MNFRQSLKYLYGLGNEVSAMKLGLENIGKLLAALGNPQNDYLKVQVAGTNGKGSTCAFLDAICVSAEIKTGLYTSPHLVSITERINMNGMKISEKDFARHATEIREISEKLIKKGELETVPTFFEQVTAIALNYFSKAKVELAILETGLGGRFDATTAANAEIIAITPIDYDHQNILGDTLEKIAAEKAAIIREDTKVVVAQQKEAALKVIYGQCANLKVKPTLTNFAAEIRGKSEKHFIVNFQTEKAEYSNARLSLLGKHQIENAKTAILLAETLQDYFLVSTENIAAGLQTAQHKGRLEFDENFLFDGAHNIAGAEALKEFLDEFVTQPIVIIFGAMRDKDLTEIAAVLFPKAAKLIFTVPDNPRSTASAELLKYLSEDFKRENVLVTETVREAIEKAKKVSSENHLILITGSLYLVGEAQAELRKTF